MKETDVQLCLAALIALAPLPVAAQRTPPLSPTVSLSAGAQLYADSATSGVSPVQVSVLIHVAGGQTNNTDVQSGTGTQRDPAGKLINHYWDSEASAAWAAPALDLDVVQIHIFPIRPGAMFCSPIGLTTRTTRGQGASLEVWVNIPADYHYQPQSATVDSVQIAPGPPTTAWAAPPRVEGDPRDHADPTRLILSLPEARPDQYSPAFYSVQFSLVKDTTR